MAVYKVYRNLSNKIHQRHFFHLFLQKIIISTMLKPIRTTIPAQIFSSFGDDIRFSRQGGRRGDYRRLQECVRCSCKSLPWWSRRGWSRRFPTDVVELTSAESLLSRPFFSMKIIFSRSNEYNQYFSWKETHTNYPFILYYFLPLPKYMAHHTTQAKSC